MSKKIIGYTLGPDHFAAGNPKPQPVHAFTDAQQAFITKLTKMEARIAKLEETLKKASAARVALTATCKHPVFIDTAAFLYDSRACAVCGKHLEDL
jgi:hypothetical protein